MIKVATTLDAPIKILWPRSSDFSTSKGFTMLGLGDIVVPGAFVTLALRRDLFMSDKRDPYRSFPKPYFTAAIMSYVVGLICTMAVMHTWKAAQPALLYLRFARRFGLQTLLSLTNRLQSCMRFVVHFHWSSPWRADAGMAVER